VSLSLPYHTRIVMCPPRAGGSGRGISLSGDVIWPQSEWIARLDEWLSRWPAHKYINWHLQNEYDKDGENILNLKETNSTVLFCMLDELVGLFCRRRRRRVFGGSAPSCGSFTKKCFLTPMLHFLGARRRNLR